MDPELPPSVENMYQYRGVYIGYGEYNATTGKMKHSPDINCGVGLCVDPAWANGIPQGVSNRTANGRVVSSAIRKDTVIIPAGGYVVVAFQADNPGYWIMHCHIEEHLLNGMAVVLQEYSPGQQWSPPDGMNLHGSFRWAINDYYETLNRSAVCNSLPPTTNLPINPTTAPLNPSAAEFRLSPATFGVVMAIIAVLFTSVVFLVIVSILICICKGRKKQIELAVPKEEVPMTETTRT